LRPVPTTVELRHTQELSRGTFKFGVPSHKRIITDVFTLEPSPESKADGYLKQLKPFQETSKGNFVNLTKLFSYETESQR
jgi:hypothetical protein